MDVKLPQLAEGVEGGTVVNIMVSEGQEIQRDQPSMELETQKAVGSIPAPQAGVVTKIHVKQGMEVTVGTVLISIETANAGKAASSAGPSANPSAAKQPSAPTAPVKSSADTGAENDDYRYNSKSGVPPPAAPSIRKLARDLDIDLTRVRGSEAGGRIVLADLRAYIQKLQELASQRSAAPSSAERATTSPGAPATIDFAKWG